MTASSKIIPLYLVYVNMNPRARQRGDVVSLGRARSPLE